MLSSACTLDNIQDFLNELGLKPHIHQVNIIFFHYIMSSSFSVRPTIIITRPTKIGHISKNQNQSFQKKSLLYFHNVVSCPNCTQNLERYLMHIFKVRKSPKNFFLSSIHPKNWKKNFLDFCPSPLKSGQIKMIKALYY